MGHDIEIISHDELDPVSNSVYLSVADCTSNLHRININCYHCISITRFHIIQSRLQTERERERREEKRREEKRRERERRKGEEKTVMW
jgi:sRNA-binding protein